MARFLMKDNVLQIKCQLKYLWKTKSLLQQMHSLPVV